MRIKRLLIIAVLLGLLSLAGCYGSVSVAVPVGSPYGPYGYPPAYGPYGPYGTVRISSGPMMW